MSWFYRNRTGRIYLEDFTYPVAALLDLVVLLVTGGRYRCQLAWNISLSGMERFVETMSKRNR